MVEKIIIAVTKNKKNEYSDNMRKKNNITSLFVSFSLNKISLKMWCSGEHINIWIYAWVMKMLYIYVYVYEFMWLVNIKYEYNLLLRRLDRDNHHKENDIYESGSLSHI